LTILLDAPVSVGMGRIANREHDHFEREEAEFFERVRKTYLDIAAAEPARVCIVDASQTPSAVRESIDHALERFRARFAVGSGAQP
jgi:dTMP kinase